MHQSIEIFQIEFVGLDLFEFFVKNNET